MKVTLHKSNDGALHETAKACAKRNIELRVLDASKGATYDMASFQPDDRNNEALYPEGISSFIAANADVLRKILNDSLVAKRPRKPRAPKAAKPAAKSAVSPSTAEL